VHVHDRDGHTALHAASAMDHSDVVRLLLERGSGATIQDFEGNTPLHLAVDAGAIASVRILLESGNADPTIRNNAEQTPLDLVEMLPARNRDTMRSILLSAKARRDAEASASKMLSSSMPSSPSGTSASAAGGGRRK
jgi:ankyrin repeat protein